MTKILFVLALLLSFSTTSFAQTTHAKDTSCMAAGDTVSTVMKGGVTINMSCPAMTSSSDFPCDCHAPMKDSGKCRVYACNSMGEEKPVSGSDAGAPQNDGPLTQGASPLSGYSDFGAREAAVRKAGPRDELALGLKLMDGSDGNMKNPATGMDLIYEAAGRGYAPAQAVLGAEMLQGNTLGQRTDDEVDQDVFYWFSEASAQGDPDGAARLGAMYAAGKKFVTKNPNEAYFWLKLAVKEAQNQPDRPTPKPGSPYLTLDAMSRMLDDARKELSPGDIAGIDAALSDWQPNLPAILTPVKPGETTVQKQAEQLKEMKAQAEAQRAYDEDQKKRDQWQQEHPGEVYPADRPPPPTLDDLKAQSSAAQGALADAQTAWKQQLKDIQDRAAKGDPQAEFDLGYLYLRGDGKEAAPPAGLNIDQVYAGQKRVTPAPNVSLPQDFAKAYEWYKKAADKGNVEAQYNLGEMYRVGRGGIPMDTEQAYFWLTVASRADQWFFADQAFLNNSGLATDKLAEIRQKAFDWKPAASAPTGNSKKK